MAPLRRDEYILLRSSADPDRTCAGCGAAVPAGEGITALVGDRIVSIDRADCLWAFLSADARDPGSALRPAWTDRRECSPASEWLA